jgi:Asp/Glu/hydantoin racemase
MTIACMHTVGSLIPVFDAEAAKLGISLRHTLRDDLLREAERAGGLNDDIAARAAAELEKLAGGAEAVLLTCSTLGPAAARAQAAVPVLRVDEALAKQAVKAGGRVVVLCAVTTTIEPSRELFERHAAATGARIEMRLVPDAWAAFRAGDRGRYCELIAAAADAAFAEGADVVALAQASMAEAAPLARNGTPLTSPAAGLAAAAARRVS